MTLFWFRRDLRLSDNVGLFNALSKSDDVLPIFIFDSNILAELPKDDARVSFIHSLLNSINKQLMQIGKSLAVFHGEPETIMKQLVIDNKITTVVTNRDYEPYAIARESRISQLFSEHSVNFETYKDQVIFERNEVVKDDGNPYVVFTPYSIKWKQLFQTTPVQKTDSENLLQNFTSHSYPFLQLSDIGFEQSKIQIATFDVSEELLKNYNVTRNFPGLDKTSKLSPYLRFGAVSIRQIITEALKYNDGTFVNELIWREFFMQILWHFPQTVSRNFRPKYDGVKWRNNELEFEQWCNGQTGYPIVDAGMRELNATGFMQNRVRMITAGFLCKHLLIDWRWGEAYFALKLLDYEQSSNVGNWQWAAGTGVDASPYFRIFNPTEQARKFDKNLDYIRKWVPEFESLTYVQPIVDHKEARERCLKVYKDAVM